VVVEMDAARPRKLLIPRISVKMQISTWENIFTGDLAERFSTLLPWLPSYFLNRTDRDPSANPLDVYWYYPVAICDDRYSDDVEPQLNELDEQLQPIAQLWQIISARLGFPVRLYECEYGANPFGCEGHPHYDSPREDIRDKHIAVIVYLNSRWDIAWGGETIVFNEQGDVISAVLPKPGRATVLEGDPYHVARGVSRTCPVARRVLVFKMWRLDPLTK
jgi:SM-20-related protein